jgi:Flp pilus assembly protein TadG
MAFVRRLQRLLLAFRSATGGNVATMFGIVLVPLLGLIGTAVDYSRANSARTALQAALDSTALMLSKEAPSLTATELAQRADQYFKALFNRTEVGNLEVTAAFISPQSGSFQLDVAAKGTVPAAFVRVFGMSEMKIDSATQVVWGLKRLEVALALDNTGSMASSGKMTELKKAVKTLLDTLQKAAKKPDDVRVAIVPFDTTVRLSDGSNPPAWVRFDGSPRRRDWTGCIEDRDQSNDVKDTAADTGTSSTLFPAAECVGGGALVKMRELTNDWTALRATVDQMTPSGTTNVTIGLAWGWHALTANAPFTTGSAPAPDLEKVIILLTDGDNTKNRWTTNSAAIDTRTELACANVKAANIKVYTVRVIAGNATLLRNCATNSSMYYDVQQASELNNVFSAIAQNLANLRVAK